MVGKIFIFSLIFVAQFPYKIKDSADRLSIK